MMIRLIEWLVFLFAILYFGWQLVRFASPSTQLGALVIFCLVLFAARMLWIRNSN